MDTSECFAHTLKPHYFSSYEELKHKMKEFEVACGVQYTIKRSIRLADDVANRNTFVYKYIQSDNCPSFINVCHSYGTLRIARYYMLHTHAGTDGLMSYGKLDSIQLNPIANGISEVDIGGCSLLCQTKSIDGDMTTDQTAVFQEHVPLRTFGSFMELERLLISFQQATGCLLVKRNSIRYPDSAPEHETLVYKSITYACCHYGNGRSLSMKTQQQKTRKINCPCIVRIGCRGKKLHIIGFVMRHNHPVTTELAETYPENRRLTEDEKLEINDFLQSAPDNLTVKEHIERKFGKPCTLNDVRQMKYRLRKLQKSNGTSHGPTRVVSSRQQNPVEADFDFDSIPPVSDWVLHPKDDCRMSQFEPLSNQLADLVCSADQETFCDRMTFLKELTEAWREGKQPMLVYSESMLKGDSCESPINTEVVTSESPFSYSKAGKTYLSFNY